MADFLKAGVEVKILLAGELSVASSLSQLYLATYPPNRMNPFHLAIRRK
jgi:hypothetical protein